MKTLEKYKNISFDPIMTLSKQHQARWDAAKKLIRGMKNKAIKNGYSICYSDMIIVPSQIKISDDEICVVIGNTTYEIFYANPAHDSGLYDTITSFRKGIKQNFKLVIFKEI